MTKLIVTFGFCVSIVSCGQANKKSQIPNTLNQIDSIQYANQVAQFIRQVKQQELNDSSFILENEPSSFDNFDCLKEAINDTTLFSKHEISTIEQQSKHPLIKFWTNSLIPNIKIVNTDTVRNIFKDNTKGWEYFYKHIGPSVNGFSAPIFLKHFNYCLFYSDYNCGELCGEGHLAVYKKEKDKWIALKSYCNWIS